MIAQQGQRGEVNRAGFDQRIDAGKSAQQAGRSDPPKRLALAHFQRAKTETEQRWMSRREVESAFFDFSQACHDLCDHRAFGAEQNVNAGEELRIGELSELHCWGITRVFSTASVAPRATIAASIDGGIDFFSEAPERVTSALQRRNPTPTAKLDE